MEFRIADTFTGSLARLAAQEQKAAKIAAFDLQANPDSPGLRFHKLDRAKDRNFWSVRVGGDLRLIVHKTASSLLLCYVGHHDAAYRWAERRKIERHPATGAAQLVEIRERVEEITIHRPSPAIVASKAPLFADTADATLLSYGVPAEWLDDVRNATEDTLLEVADHLPQEAAEALLSLAVGEAPRIGEPALRQVAFDLVAPAATDRPAMAPIDAAGFDHPDAQRRFRVLTNVEELERALEFPWEKWTIFLHPAQRHLVERDYNGPARISGSAGTGKTIVALHRAAFLARKHRAAKILVTTFSKALANALQAKLRHLVGNEPNVASRIAVRSITGIGYEMYAELFGQPNIAAPALGQSLLREGAAEAGATRVPQKFLLGEWNDVVDAWQLRSWEAYRDVARLGRKTRIGGKQRETLWAIFSQVRAALDKRKLVTWADVFSRLTDHLQAGGKRPFDCAVVDEAQDIAVAECRFLAALAGGNPDGLFFTGDLGQRIFQLPFSWKSLGVDVRGRSHTLRINYRTSHQIRMQADRLLPDSLADVDGNAESRRGTVSVFNGPPPEITVLPDEQKESAAVGKWIAARLAEGLRPHEIAVFVRSERQLRRARVAAKAAGAAPVELGEKVETTPDRVAIATMHLAKGLEFRAVAVMACDDEIVPLQERIESLGDDADLEDAYNTERHLLYVACTRARDHLLVTGVEPASEFLDDLSRARSAQLVAGEGC